MKSTSRLRRLRYKAYFMAIMSATPTKATSTGTQRIVMSCLQDPLGPLGAPLPLSSPPALSRSVVGKGDAVEYSGTAPQFGHDS